MEKFSIKKLIIFPLILLLMFTFIGSLFLFSTNKEKTVLSGNIEVSKLIEKYSPGKVVKKIIDNEYLTEEKEKKISIEDFCKLTNTTCSEDENFINLTYNDFTLEINKENNFFVVNNEDVVYIEEKNENSLYPLNDLATALGFKATFNENNVKLSRPYQTKRVIVKASGEFDSEGAIEVINAYKDTYLLQYKSELEAKQAIDKLNLQENVVFAEPNVIVSLEDDIDVEKYNFDTLNSNGTFLSWGGDMLGIDDYKTYLQSAIGEDYLKPITVAVLDTGIDTDHPMFEGRISQYSHNYVDTANSSNPEDDHGHGTHVAGIICDLTYKNVKILALKVLDANGNGELINITNAIEYAISLKATSIPNLAVLNMSFGADAPIDSYNYTSKKTAIDDAYAAGILSVVAAGNGDERNIAIDVKNACPANISTAITVGAVGIDDSNNYYIGTFSNYGEFVDISAPGINIESASHEGGTIEHSGTSMATPHISAVVALLLSDKLVTYENLAELEDALDFYTIDVGDAGWDKYYGVGVPDLTYAHCDKLTPVKFSKEETKCSESFDLVLTHENTEPGVKILYTLNGETPNVQNATTYTAPITISTSTTVKAIACVMYEGSITKCSKVSQMTYRFDFIVDETGTLIQYNGTDSEIIVPATVNGIEVVAIGENCFMEKEITSVTLPESVVTIQYGAFASCQNLVKVVAPGVQFIETLGFYACTSLKYLNDIYFPQLQFISRSAFMYCTSLTSINLPTLLEIEENAFAFCTKLISINLENLLILDTKSFFNCSLLSSANLPLCQVISTKAFMNCRFSSVSFPNLLLLGAGVFSGNIHLDSANLPQVIYIGNSAFSSTPLGVIFAQNVQIVGRSAFFGCDELTSIDFPNAIRIENAAFANTALTSINLDSARIIEGLVFQNVPASSISLPSVVKIYASAFEHLDTLNTLTLSHCIEELEKFSINSCTNCTIKGYANTVAHTYAIENGYRFQPINTSASSLTYEIVDNKEIHITGYLENLTQNAIIPDYIEGLPVTTIKANAFKNCTKIQKIQSSTITTIEDSAFENATTLETIILSKIKTIGNSAFKGCENLKNITIDTAETIGDSAFENCGGFGGFNFYNPSVIIGNMAFGFENGVKKQHFTIYCYQGSTAETYAKDNEFNCYYIANELNAFYYGIYITEEQTEEFFISFVPKAISGEIILPSEYNGTPISAIGNEAFKDCSFITKVTLPSSYKLIGQSAFSSCSLLTSINLENVVEVGNFAFEYCYRLKNVNLASATYLGESAFYYCSLLETANIPKITEIKTNTFYACSTLHTVLGDNITTIGEWAFWQTKNLTNINLKKTRVILGGFCVSFEELYLPSIEILGDSALNSNGQLTKIVINKTISSIGTYALPRIGAETIVYGYKDTVAKSYTTANNIPFVPIEDLEIKENTKLLYQFDNISVDPKVVFETKGFEVNYIWFRNDEQTKIDADLVKESGENFYAVDKAITGDYFVYCVATDWKGDTVVSNLSCVEVRHYVYYTITTTVYGNGRISPEGIIYVKENDRITLYFLPDQGYKISNVVVDGKSVGEAISHNCSNIIANHTIEVYFTITQHTITLSTNGFGTISPSGDNNGEIVVDYGTEKTFYFTPSTGYKLSRVTVDNKEVKTTDSSYTLLFATRDYYIVAYFEIITLEVNIISNGGLVNPVGRQFVNYGDPLEINVSNTVECKIVKVLCDGEPYIEVGEQYKKITISDITKDTTIEIIAIPHPYFITVKTGENGSAQNSVIATYYGQTEIVNLIPDAGYKVSKVLLNGEVVDTSNTIEIKNICSDSEISASFEKIIYTISFDLGGFGEIVETESDTATYGEDRTYTIKTNPLYQIDDVFINNKKVELIDGNKISLKGIDNNFDVKVTFKKNLSVPVAIIVIVAILLILTIVLLLYIKRRIKLEHRKKTNLTTMLHTSKKTDIKTIKIKDEFLLDDDETPKRRRKTNKK